MYDKKHRGQLFSIFGEVLTLCAKNDIDFELLAYFAKRGLSDIYELEKSEKWNDGDSGIDEFREILKQDAEQLILEKRSE